jgi:hypothetical protein
MHNHNAALMITGGGVISVGEQDAKQLSLPIHHDPPTPTPTDLIRNVIILECAGQKMRKFGKFLYGEAKHCKVLISSYIERQSDEEFRKVPTKSSGQFRKVPKFM